MILVDFELAQGRAGQALALMSDAPATDSIMVRQAIAQKALGDEGELARLKVELRGRIDAAAAAGLVAHAREAARYWLEVEGDAAKALAAAEANWTDQRELEDALLLISAAYAAGKPEAAQVVRNWANAQACDGADVCVGPSRGGGGGGVNMRSVLLAWLAAAFLVAAPAYAHQTSLTYISVADVEGGVTANMKLSFLDLEVAVGVDQDFDGEITWGEAKSRLDSVTAYARARTTFTGGGACKLQRTAAKPEMLNGDGYST